MKYLYNLCGYPTTPSYLYTDTTDLKLFILKVQHKGITLSINGHIILKCFINTIHSLFYNKKIFLYRLQLMGE